MSHICIERQFDDNNRSEIDLGGVRIHFPIREQGKQSTSCSPVQQAPEKLLHREWVGEEERGKRKREV